MKNFKITFKAYAQSLSACLNPRSTFFRILVVVFLIGLGTSVVYRGGIGTPKRTDLTVYLRAAEAVQTGENIYHVQNARHWNYVYLPLLATLLTPFTKLPLPLNVFLWYLLSVAALFGVFLLSLKHFQEPRNDLGTVILLMILCLPSFLNTMARGQLGMIILFFAMLVFYLYFKRRDFWAGFALAFIMILKLTPLCALVPYFILKKEWKVCWGIFCGTVLFLLIYPSLILGPEKNLNFLAEWYRIVQHGVSDLGYQSHLWKQLITPFAEDNQSLYAVLTRWFWPSEESLVGQTNQWIRAGVNGFGLLALLAIIFAGCKDRRSASGELLFLEYSLFPMLMIFISPVSEIHHYTVLYLIVLSAWLILQKFSPGSRPYWVILSGILIATVSFLVGLIFEPLSYLGFPLLGALILWLMLLVILFIAKQGSRVLA